jgi:putative Mn2+ efflux pump MntP
MAIIEIILMALSLSVDTLVVSMCGSVTLGKINFGNTAKVALSFALMQTALLSAGWLFGNSIVRYIESIAGVVGFLLLLYIGVNMIRGALKKGGEESVNLSGLKQLVLASVATSIDAAAVSIVISIISVFMVTAAAAVTGVVGGCAIGHKFGKPAQITGGAVLIAIGLKILIG